MHWNFKFLISQVVPGRDQGRSSSGISIIWGEMSTYYAQLLMTGCINCLQLMDICDSTIGDMELGLTQARGSLAKPKTLVGTTLFRNPLVSYWRPSIVEAWFIPFTIQCAGSILVKQAIPVGQDGTLGLIVLLSYKVRSNPTMLTNNSRCSIIGKALTTWFASSNLKSVSRGL